MLNPDLHMLHARLLRKRGGLSENYTHKFVSVHGYVCVQVFSGSRVFVCVLLPILLAIHIEPASFENQIIHHRDRPHM